MKRSLALVLFLLASACASRPAPRSEPVHVVIVGTTDVHGWFAGHVETPPGGGAGVVWGGLPAFSAYVEALRAADPGRVIVVDSGDMWQGTLESNMFEGEAVVRGYNVIAYAAAAVGNHEFDFGPAGAEAIARAPQQDELGAVKRNAALANFPFLSANMVEKASGRTPSWAKRYTIVRAGDARVGIIGLSTPDTPNVTMAANVVRLSFTDPVAATISAAQELRAQGVDAIVVVAHMGGRCTSTQDPNDVASCAKDQEAWELLQKLPAGTVDAYFAGHTHSQMRHYVNGVPAVQAAAFSREFSTVDLWIDVAKDRVTKSEMRPLTMICTHTYEGTERCDPRNAPAGAKLVPRVYEGMTIMPDPRVGRTIEPFLRRVAAKRDEKVNVRVAALFPRGFFGETALGDLIADSLRRYASTDFAFMNSGGIRAELPAKDLTYGDVFAVSPFDNFPSVVTMTGAEIIETLRLTSQGTRGIIQVSGLRYTIDAAKDEDKPAAERNRIVGVTRSDGTPLDPNGLYTVAMPDFLAAGGDNTDAVMSRIARDRISISYARPIRDALADVWAKLPQPLEPKTDGRITVLNPPRQ
ncbi:MAG TPA: 5'-nucleotidase C-terminal domain-containing protein [Thermoanaerobaculia bacterium]|jgi:5'-nucleotidase|nr:5'-nucleotidase C-terminal domain-containing protein [Thermoanaerobaculia bacterium]